MLVMKSISKSYGVPGIRLGILCSADVDIISRIKKMVSIWNLNSFCEFFMQIYTKYEKDYKKACNKFIEERNDFEAKLRTIGFLRVIPSQANYFLVEVLPPFTAKTLVLRMLKEHNILMRDCSGKGGFDNKQYMRIAVRDHDDNARLIESLRMIGEGL
jgi:histidinol-phosphate/aromatic aminotransferase/cobyric acid decarboxylase-like protein